MRRLERDLQEAKQASLRVVGESLKEPPPEMVAQFHAQVHHLQEQVKHQNGALHSKAAEIDKLNQRLLAAQEAIVAGTEYGWEKDIKLAQARRALLSIVKDDSADSPRAAESGGATAAQRQLAADRSRLSELQERKTKAVEMEDYSTAQQCLDEANELAAKIGALGGAAGAAPPASPAAGVWPPSPAAIAAATEDSPRQLLNPRTPPISPAAAAGHAHLSAWPQVGAALAAAGVGPARPYLPTPAHYVSPSCDPVVTPRRLPLHTTLATGRGTSPPRPQLGQFGAARPPIHPGATTATGGSVFRSS